MLRVVCPYVPGMLRPGTRAALETFLHPGQLLVEGDGLDPDVPLTLEYLRLSPTDPLMYGREMARLWGEALERGDDLAVVEHDNEIGPSTLYDFRACLHGWCANPYPWVEATGVALGCTRWRYAFMAAHETAMDEAVAMAPHYRQFGVVLDRRILAEKYHQQPHVHAPIVHLNAARALREGVSPVPLEGVPVGDIGALL